MVRAGSLLAVRLWTVVFVAAGAAARMPTDGRCSCTPRALHCNGLNLTQLHDEDLCEEQVTEWVLSHNRLPHLHFLPSPCRIVMLDVSHNNIRSVDERLRTCDKLLLLLLSFNPLYSVPRGAFEGMTNLAYLELERTNITELREGTFRGLPVLYSLNVRGNKLTELPEDLFKDLSTLNFIDVSENEIAHFPDKLFQDLVQLRVLNVSENRLVRLQPELFANSRQILSLLLSGNKLVHLQDELFSGLLELRRLEVQRNELKQLPVLAECCAYMSFADFSSNNISAPDVEAVKALLGVSHRLETQVHANPVRRAALCAVLRAGEVGVCAPGGRCLCGRLRPCHESRQCWSFVEMCEAGCNATFQDWHWLDSENADVTDE